MKKIIILFNILSVAGISSAQTGLTISENYIYTKSYLSEDGTKHTETVEYFDGLGRTKQRISVKASPAGKDLVIPVVYDALGRQTKDILPVPMSTNNAGIQVVSEAAANAYYGVNNAYSEKSIEASPIGKVLEIAPPGTEWAMGSGHTQQFGYDVNITADQVKKFTVTHSWQNATAISSIPSVGIYGEKQLIKNTITDEDGNTKIEFKNGNGQIILVRKLGNTDHQDTYYIYNLYGQLVYVISPKAVTAITANGNTVTQQILDELCYQYKYDHKSRQVEKKLPGKGWEYFVYDLQNRLVASQDANMRNDGLWAFTRYDQFGRTVYTGQFAGGTRHEEQAIANTKGLNNEARNSSTFTTNNQQVFYTNTAYPVVATFTLCSINYYDTYPGTNIFNTLPQPTDILAQNTLFSSPTSFSINGVSSIRSTKGMPTTSLVKNIENDGWSKNYVWYDTKGRTIGTYSFNYLGGYTKTETELDFAGSPLKSYTYHSRDGGAIVTVKERFVYNPKNTLLKHYHQVNNNTEVLLTENTYNDLGQLINKKVGNNLESVDYQYNIRGWLTRINNPYNLNGKLFGYGIQYHDPYNTTLDPARYNGNISEVSWASSNDNVLKRYTYYYDAFNRLSSAQFSNPNASVPLNHWNDETITYDLNGNILSLQRNAKSLTGNTAELIDNLEYGYEGNRLTAVNDYSGNSNGYEGGGNGLEYDENGNMLNMPDKGIDEIRHNALNLPNALRIEGTQKKLFYLYRADGTKLRKLFNYVDDNQQGFTTITDYLDGFQYQSTVKSKLNEINPIEYAYLQEAFLEETFEEQADLQLQFFPTAEGYYDYVNGEYIYQYKDHLGNVRVSYKNINNMPEITDQNDYYPFGMVIPREDQLSIGTSGLYNYQYNNKELQETGMYDYGARMYMADLGRWGVVDPLAEASRSWTPYNYGYNNPLMFIDPDGRLSQSFINMIVNSPDGTVWTNNGAGFTSNWGQMIDYEGTALNFGSGGSLKKLNAYLDAYGSIGGGGGFSNADYINNLIYNQLVNAGVNNPATTIAQYSDIKKILQIDVIKTLVDLLAKVSKAKEGSKIEFVKTNNPWILGHSLGYTIELNFNKQLSVLQMAYVIGHEIVHSISDYFRAEYLDLVKSHGPLGTGSWGYFTEYISYSWDYKMGSPFVFDAWDYTYCQHGPNEELKKTLPKEVYDRYRYPQETVDFINTNLPGVMKAYNKFIKKHSP